MDPQIICYSFCPWVNSSSAPDDDPTNCLENSVYNSLPDTSYCCNNSSFYLNSYLIDTCSNSDVSNIRQYGILFDVSDTDVVSFINSAGTEMHQHILKFTTAPSMSLGNNRYSYTKQSTSIPNPSSLTQNIDISSQQFGTLSQYINCSGDWTDICYATPGWAGNDCSLSKIPPSLAILNNWCWGQPNMSTVCEISNVNISYCNKLHLPKSGYGPTNDYFGVTQTPSSDFITFGDNGVQSAMQDAMTTLVNTFTRKINSLTNPFGNNLQFPNLGTTRYLDIGSCNNNCPYIYNNGCDNSMGYLQQYTCYPSVTGAFSDCGPPAYEPVPSFY